MSKNCQDALEALYPFIDGELDDAARRELAAHLDECGPCLGAFDFEAELRIVISQRCRDTVPEALRLRIRAALDDAAASE